MPPVDVITGGSPCQDLSVAGKRTGLDGERSGLFHHQIRIIKEMRELDKQKGLPVYLRRPRYMVWENVPGAFSSNGGKDFQAVLTEIVRIADPEAPDVPMPDKGKWSKSGCLYDEMGKWSVAWRVHDAQFWGVPQRRKRIALVADFGGLSAPEILFERKGLRGYFEESGTTWQRAAGSAAESTGSAISFQERAGCNGRGWKDGVSYTLNTIDRHSVAFTMQAFGDYKDCGISSGLKARDYKDATDLVTETQPIAIDRAFFNKGQNALYDPNLYEDGVSPPLIARGPNAVCVRYIVRRLTPTECERLQGFPDGWTDIGEWTDSKGKKRKTTDSARYKALGNSIALPFWQYLARRICAQYERDVTMASLFDGIGGFPLVFERCGAKAVWASEIEEFPIAVTKIRFPEVDDDE